MPVRRKTLLTVGREYARWASIMALEKGSAGPSSAMTSASPASTLGQLWQVPLFLVGLAAVLGVWATRPLWYDPETVQLRRDLADARGMLQEPHAALNGLTVRLSEALSHIDRLPKRAGEAHFLLGSVYLRLAGEVPPASAADLWQKVRSHLEQAEQLGVPEADRATLLYRLAQAWYQTGGNVERVIDYLSKSIDQVDDDRAAGYAILTQCYMRLPVPNVQAALEANEKQLQLPTDDENRLVSPRLIRGELYMRKQEWDKAQKVLTRIGPNSPPAIVARARFLLAQSYQEEEAWAEAAKLWEAVLADQRQPPADPVRVRYLLGVCYDNLHRPADAARPWERIEEEAQAEGQAARLRLAHVRIAMGNIPAGLELYGRALDSVHKPADYPNKLVSLVQAGEILASDCRSCTQAGNFEAAEKLARLYARLASPGPAHVLAGQVAETWASALHIKAQQLKDATSARQQEAAAQGHFREAAAAYDAAAAATAGQPEQAEWLWHAGACSLHGQDFRHAIDVYQRFAQLHPPAARLSETWYRLGEAYQALGEDPSAERAYEICIQTGAPFDNRARYERAMVEVRRGNADGAEEMLEHLLRLLPAGIELDRETQERTLYALADLAFLRREFTLAAQCWEQALKFYPANPAAWTARYRLGQAYRSLADQEAQAPGMIGSPDPRSRYRGWPGRRLEHAAAHFQKLVDDLQARQAAAPLQENDALLLRQARFALAECRFDLGLYTDAIPVYISLANQCEHEVEGLSALKQLYRCYLASMSPDKPQENLDLAARTLETMRALLAQLDSAAFQGRPVEESRAVLEGWLKSQEQQLKDLKGPEKPPS
jgi:tetratricopeptide (TPR) repeat protein